MRESAVGGSLRRRTEGWGEVRPTYLAYGGFTQQHKFDTAAGLWRCNGGVSHNSLQQRSLPAQLINSGTGFGEMMVSTRTPQICSVRHSIFMGRRGGLKEP